MNLRNATILLALAGGSAGVANASSNEPADAQGGGGRNELPHRPHCISPAHEREILERIEAYARTLPVRPRGNDLDTAFSRYPFFPQSGTLWSDLFINNYVDLNASSAVGDAYCRGYSYDGHRGIDIDTVGFAEQDIGVPVYAVLDGTVADAHDGEFDRNTSWNNQPANYVILHHGGQHYTWYYHLRNGSVAVSAGQQVKAGRQLGQMASSGVSTGPHLHFESRIEGSTIEPFVGSCRPGESLWIDQPPLNETTYLREFVITDQSLSGWNGPPNDTSRKGTFVQGTRTVYFWINLLNMSSGQTYAIRFVRPDGSVAQNEAPRFFSGTHRWSWWWWSRTVNLNQTGTWHLEYTLSGMPTYRAPFTVVATPAEVVNRPPHPVTVSFDSAGLSPDEVPVCRVQAGPLFEDPDYDAIRYRYVWKRNDTVMRDVISALTSDALPRQSVVAGDTLTCEVRPFDGLLHGPTSAASWIIHQPYAAWAQDRLLAPEAHAIDTDNDDLPDGIEYRLGTDPHSPTRLPAITRDVVTGKAMLALPPSPMSDPAVAFDVLVSANLEDWEPAGLNAERTAWVIGDADAGALFARFRASFGSPVETTVLLRNLLP